MPYTVKGKCVYKKDSGAKVGCTKGSVDKYLAALHANAKESIMETLENSTLIDFIKSLEGSKILAIGSHNNQTLIDTISAIISLSEKDFRDYITKNPNKNVKIIRTEFNDWVKSYKINESNKIKGGKADKLSVKDIAKKFNVTVDYLNQQIEKGIKVEIEHTKDKEKASEIAMDHLSEFPDYYERLEKLETQAKKQWELNETKKFIKQRLRESLTSTHIEINEDYGYCVGNVHNDTAKIMNWFSFRKFDYKKYEKYLKKPVAFLNNIYVEERGVGYGNQLYSEFEEECYSNDAKCIVLECDTGNEQNEGFDLKKWYESFDYEVIGVERGYPIMIKYLS